MSRKWTWTVLLIVFLLVSGCRSYGGYGTEAATYRQIERVLDRFEEDLARARADLRALESAATDHPILEVVAAHYAELVRAHAAALDEHGATAARLSADAGYRTLSRVYGALVGARHLVRGRYQSLLRYVYDAFGEAGMSSAIDEARPYALVPPYYPRIADRGSVLTVNEVVRRVESGAALRADFRLDMPVQVVAGPDGADGH
ncbi:MAG: hypothetical protein WD021_04960 [Rhodothermales bacterium]